MVEMKSSKILELAKEEVRAQRADFICLAIYKVQLRHSCCLDRAEKLKCLISWRLRGVNSLELWLIPRLRNPSFTKWVHWPFLTSPKKARFFEEKTRETRLRWLDSLIAEHKAKGD
jgi:hypothetical protein